MMALVFIKPLEVPQRSVKIKTSVDFSLNTTFWKSSGREGLNEVFCTRDMLNVDRKNNTTKFSKFDAFKSVNFKKYCIIFVHCKTHHLIAFINPLSTNPTKRSSMLNQFVGCSHNWSIVVCFKQTILVYQLWFWLRDYLKLSFLILSIFKRINFFYPWNLWFFDDFPGGIEVNHFA